MFTPGTFGTYRDASTAPGGVAVERLLGLVPVPPKVEGSGDAPSAPPPGSDLAQWARRTAERVRAAVLTGRVRFARWLDPGGDETAEMRRAYWKMLAEPMAFAPLSVQIESVAALDLQFHADDPDDPYQKKFSEFAQYNFDRLIDGPHQAARDVLKPAMIGGWSLTEPLLEPETQGRWYGRWCWWKWASKDVRVLWPIVDDYDHLVGIHGPGLHGAMEVFAPSDFVFYTHLKMFENPLGRSAFHAAYRAWWIKDAMWQLRGIHLEKYTSPFLLATYQPGMEQDQRQALETALQACQASTWLTVPTGVVVDAVTAATKDTSDFQSAIDDCNKEMLVAVMGSHLMVMEGSGQNVAGSSKEQRGTAELFQWGLAADLGARYTLAVKRLAVANDYTLPPPRVTVGAVNDQSLQASLEIDTGLKAMGFKHSAKAIARAYNRQEAATPDDVLGGGNGAALNGAPPNGPPTNGPGRNGRPALPPGRNGGGEDRSARTYAEYHFAEGRWITIGGTEGADGHRHGGSPVYVENGRITKGAPGLVGKSPHDIKGGAADTSHRTDLKRSRDYETARHVKAARKEGIDPAHLHALAGEMMAHDRGHVKDRTAALQRARKLSEGLGYGGLGTVKARSGRGRLDADAVRGLDDVAALVAGEHPAQFAGHEDDLSGRLFDMLSEGNPRPMPEHEAYAQALDHLRRHGGDRHEAYTPSEEAIPFSERPPHTFADIHGGEFARGGGRVAGKGGGDAPAPSGRVQSILDAADKIKVTGEPVEGDGPEGVWGENESGDDAFRFSTAGGRYGLTVEPRDSGLFGGHDHVDFADASGRTDVTGAGGAAEAMTKVSAALVALVRHRPRALLHFEANEDSRQRLYDRLTRTVAAALPGYAAVAVARPGKAKVYVVGPRARVEAVKAKLEAKGRGPQVLAHSERAGATTPPDPAARRAAFHGRRKGA